MGVGASTGPRLTFSENPGKFSSPSQNPGNHRQSSDGIVHGCTNHDPRRGSISVT